jgi:hypothetical protein
VREPVVERFHVGRRVGCNVSLSILSQEKGVAAFSAFVRVIMKEEPL